MAHSGHRLRALSAGALLALAGEAHALALGEPIVRSSLGENLDARFPVTLERGESIEPSCFQLVPGTGGDVPRVVSGSVSLERSASGTYLRLRSPTVVTDPALAVGIVAKCPGQASEYNREFTLLVDPPKGAATTAASPAAPAPESAPKLPTIATRKARIGDTLESIAKAIFPSNHAARVSYVQALRASNPPLAKLKDDEPIPVDTPIALPDLRTFSAAQRTARTPRAHGIAGARRGRRRRYRTHDAGARACRRAGRETSDAAREDARAPRARRHAARACACAASRSSPSPPPSRRGRRSRRRAKPPPPRPGAHVASSSSSSPARSST